MGLCQSNSCDPGLECFRESIFGSFPSSSYELLELYNLGQHQHQAQSSTLSLSPDTAFYLVVSGEVVVYMSNETRKLVAATVFKAGDIVYFVPGVTISKGIVVFNGIKLTYQLRTSDASEKGAHLVKFAREPLVNFIETRPHLSRMGQLIDPKADFLSSFLSLPGFKNLNVDQLRMMISLMNISHASIGQVIKVQDKTPLSNRHKTHSTDSGNQVDSLLKPLLSERSMGLLLTGSCAHIPDVSELLYTANQVRNSSVDASSTGKKTTGISTNLYTIKSGQTSIELDGSLNNNRIYPGSVFGYEHFFIQNNMNVMDNILSIEDSWIGSLSRDTMKVLFSMDIALKYYLRRNYYTRILDSVRDTLPLLRDLDEDMYSSLCSKITLRYYNADENIFQKGQNSRYAYIIVQGLVQEYDIQNIVETEKDMKMEGAKSTMSFTPNSPTSLAGNLAYNIEAALGTRDHSAFSIHGTNSSPNQISKRYLAMGSLFGEVSLITESPYFSSTMAAENTIVVCLSKRSIDLVYNKDKAKLAELRMKLSGNSVMELEHILLHPQANKLFLNFCEKELSTENVHFFNSVIKYEEMYENIMYNILHSVPIAYWQRLLDYDREQHNFVSRPDSHVASPAISLHSSENNTPKSVSFSANNNAVSISASDAKAPSIVTLKHTNTLMRSNTGNLHETAELTTSTTIITLKNLPSSTSMMSGSSARSLSRQSSMNSTLLAYTAANLDPEEVDGAIKDLCKSIYFNNINHLSSQFGTEAPSKGNTLDKIIENQGEDPTAEAENSFDHDYLLDSYSKIQQQIKEMKEVATYIMDKFIYQNSRSEVNIPSTIRNETVNLYQMFLHQPKSCCIERLMILVIDKFVHNKEIDQHGRKDGLFPHLQQNPGREKNFCPITTIYAADGSSNVQQVATSEPASPLHQQVSGNTLFQSAKLEIFKLMKVDTYSRFKQTEECKTFVQNIIKPYNQLENVNTVNNYAPMTIRDNSFSKRSSLMCMSEDSGASGLPLTLQLHTYASIHGYNNTPQKQKKPGKSNHLGVEEEDDEMIGQLELFKKSGQSNSKKGIWTLSFQRNLSAILPIDT